ncbi:hypothetical protein Q0Z83_014860 [Actinoplanes sichuanensis]|nr:hypothetical protein Q0Z83_014860 [Actinoplanes sichuanensis]
MTDDSKNPTCCFCFEVIRVEDDEHAMRIRLDQLLGLGHKQQMYTHSTCLRERLYDGIEVWWE